MQGSFLYFLDGKKFDQVKREDLAANSFLAGPFFELIHSPKVFRERLIGGNVIDGPERKAGCIVAIQPQVETDQVPGYFPERQAWAKFGPQHIGYQTDMKPGPESLRRANLISGYEVELGDGQVWRAPTVRPFHEDVRKWGCNLPMVVGLDAEAKRTARVIERYRAVWELTGQVADFIFNGAPQNLYGRFESAVTCLGLNYRIGEAEASILELFDSDTIGQTLGAAVDEPMVDQMIQGTEKNPT